MKTRQRCHETGCRHAPNVHDAAGGCLLCACTGWLDHKPHTWRRLVTDTWFDATLAWLRQREEAGVGYEAETREFEERHPRPRLKDFMAALSPNADPDALTQATHFDVCKRCSGTGHEKGTAA